MLSRDDYVQPLPRNHSSIIVWLGHIGRQNFQRAFGESVNGDRCVGNMTKWGVGSFPESSSGATEIWVNIVDLN